MIIDSMSPATGQRRVLQSAIATRLASGHGRHWDSLSDNGRADYLRDAAALIDQGMTALWEDRDPGPFPSLELEVEAAEFDRAMQWWIDFVSARHPGWGHAGGVAVSPEMENLDPEDWDAWVSIAVSVSDQARRLYMRQFEQLHGVPAPAPSPPAPAVAVSCPPAVDGVRRHRFATAIAAVLAHRHGREWMRQPSDVRAAYVNDANRLIDAGLTCW
ncbi:hypothetical protein DQP56_00800 [Mycolicibacter senuensis]|uniref:Uncharacterized protein n=2 Tax=Mycobacteriaceae TaxID=1762 RepID=A0A1X1YBY2_9MYCO|nr:hypothetical protein AWC16_19060 [Mycolicibacter longobardus]RAV04389.1 hypothetical protein DQP56_00800 [Mycolicibacter senuensis]